MPNPISVSVYGKDASARVTPNSCWTAGSTTDAPYMPTPLMVISASETTRRVQA